jgi:hypothetical protein
MHFAHASNDRAAGTTGIPCAMVYGLWRALPGVRAFLVTVARGIITRGLDPGIGGSGPHAFAVRFSFTRRVKPSRPSHPAPRFVTIAKRLCSGRGTAQDIHLILSSEKAKYFSLEALTRFRKISPTGKSVHAAARPDGAKRVEAIAEIRGRARPRALFIHIERQARLIGRVCQIFSFRRGERP